LESQEVAPVAEDEAEEAVVATAPSTLVEDSDDEESKPVEVVETKPVEVVASAPVVEEAVAESGSAAVAVVKKKIVKKKVAA
jgi:hypothetical protein